MTAKDSYFAERKDSANHNEDSAHGWWGVDPNTNKTVWVTYNTPNWWLY